MMTMRPTETQSLRIRGDDVQWVPTHVKGHDCAALYRADAETVALHRLSAGAALPPRSSVGGEEVFVVQGSARLQDGANGPTLQAWSWLRRPGRDHAGLYSPNGALLWIKRGHLPDSLKPDSSNSAQSQ